MTRIPAAGTRTAVRTARDWTVNTDLIAAAHTVIIDEPLLLDCGRVLAGHTVNFETYGTLSAERDNAVLVCHSLTKGAHAAGRHAPGDARPGWWDAAIGPGKMLDTDRYFVICVDTLCAGASSGPASIDPETGTPYGLRFPVVTVRDMVAAQRQLMSALGIERLHAAVGGCFGGQQVLEWLIGQPAALGSGVVITTTPTTSAHSIAIFSVMRHLIRADPAWSAGDYYGATFPTQGLNSAVAAAIPLWMSREAMDARFGRRTPSGGEYKYTLDDEFQVELFIKQLAEAARHELDPNGLMYLMRAVEYFDLEHSYGGLDSAFAAVSAPTMFVSYRRDWRYPAAETELMHRALSAAGGRSKHLVLDSGMGHGAFLFDVPGLAQQIRGFLDDPAL